MISPFSYSLLLPAPAVMQVQGLLHKSFRLTSNYSITFYGYSCKRQEGVLMQLFVEKNRSVRDILFGFLLAEILQISVWETKYVIKLTV